MSLMTKSIAGNWKGSGAGSVKERTAKKLEIANANPAAKDLTKWRKRVSDGFFLRAETPALVTTINSYWVKAARA